MELKQYQAGLCKILSRQLEKQLSLPELEGKNLIDTYGINSLIALEIIIRLSKNGIWTLFIEGMRMELDSVSFLRLIDFA